MEQQYFGRNQNERGNQMIEYRTTNSHPVWNDIVKVVFPGLSCEINHRLRTVLVDPSPRLIKISPPPYIITFGDLMERFNEIKREQAFSDLYP